MALVKKENREYTIQDDKINEYLEKGYSLIENGVVTKEGKSQSKDSLLASIAELEHENAALKAELEQLKGEKASRKTAK